MATVSSQTSRTKTSASFVSRTVDHIGDLLLQRTSSNEHPTDEERQTSGGSLRQRRWLHHSQTSNASDLEGPARDPGVDAAEKNKKLQESKLGTFNGVWVPTTLNVLSILMFLRFGFILGQAGVLGMLGLLAVSYIIDLITTLSVSAISSNGTVRGGGAYYLISRSLGPEFGGSIGLVFYLGFVGNTGMNAVGLVDCIINNFGLESGTMAQVFPETFWMQYLYATVVLVFCTFVCLMGSAIFSRASNILLLVLLVATFSIPVSALFMEPFTKEAQNVVYTGLSWSTLRENLLPHFTRGAAGSSTPDKENWQDLFGILFPATAGIFAGASMSGDLKNPSKSIPTGTLNGLMFTFVVYALVILSMGATISRTTLYTNVTVIQDINGFPSLVLMGEFATSFFSALMGVIGSAKSLQALARDDIFPGLSIFGQGTRSNDEPIYAILFTFVLSQLTLFGDINTIANFVTMTYLITFWVTNMACFLLKVGSAPNFRPTFRYFTWWTAAIGAVISFITMFFVDGMYASGVVSFMLALFLLVHYTTPPKSWGDVSQSLIYHQVRKYLLRLRQEHVKFWRPQILLFVNDPRRSRKLIQFCNSMKKGGLYILGHIIVTTDEFQESFAEAKRQQSSWLKYIDFTHIKAFPHVTMSPSVEWGARSIVLSAGLGGLRPNIVVLGFFNLDEFRWTQRLIDVPSPTSSPPVTSPSDNTSEPQEQLPTDNMRSERSVNAMSYVNIMEDLLLCLQMNVAVARGFDKLELPKEKNKTKKYIDLWPIQMSAETSEDGTPGNVRSTNFDTYTLILQLGCILNTVPAWKKAYTLRICVFVEFESDVDEEKQRVTKLLEKLRIQAEILVVWLSSGKLRTYEIIVKGIGNIEDPEVEKWLKDEQWWEELKNVRNDVGPAQKTSGSMDIASLLQDGPWPSSSYHQFGRSMPQSTTSTLKKLLKRSRYSGRRHSLSGLARLGLPVALNMRTYSPEEAHRSGFDSASEQDDETDVSEAGDDAPLIQNSPRRRPVSAYEGWNMPPPPSISVHPGDTSTNNTPTVTSSVSSGLLDPNTGRSRNISRPSSPHFSCNAIPDTQEVLQAEGNTGPTIRFADVSEAPVTSSEGTAIGYSVGYRKAGLSFNDVPARGQHVILNELLRQHSGKTAVIFTTLPSPPPGTCKSEEGSITYLVDLEILTVNLPPVLLVHSNSLTVTTSL